MTLAAFSADLYRKAGSRGAGKQGAQNLLMFPVAKNR